MGTSESLLSELIRETLAAFAAPKRMKLSQWADAHAYLSPESSAKDGRWTTLPYQRGILDAISDPETETVSVRKSARVGYTKCLNHTIGYHIHQDPCGILIMQPTIEDAEGYSKEEIAPMLRDTPCLQGLVAEPRSRDSGNTILHKKYPGGVLSMVGSNSPRGMRRVSRRIILFDEIDGYDHEGAGKEGDQIALGKRRAEYFWNRKFVLGSTPTVKDISKIEKIVAKGTEERFFVPCPHCGALQYLKWGGRDVKYGFKWDEGNPDSVFYVCEVNGCVIREEHKRWMIEEADRRQCAGEPGVGWVATNKNPEPRHRSFHIWAAYSYSPNATWPQLV